MSIRNMEERILTVSSVCQIDRESSKSLLQKHGWKCDLAISGYFKWSLSIYRFFDGELEEIHHSKNTVKDSPLLLFFTHIGLYLVFKRLKRLKNQNHPKSHHLGQRISHHFRWTVFLQWITSSVIKLERFYNWNLILSSEIHIERHKS